MRDLQGLKVAIVHDWLIGGGAERVVTELHHMFPNAPIYTSYATPEWRSKLDGKVVTGYLQWWPFSKLRKFVPLLRIFWFSHLNLSRYDLVISSSGAEAKGIRIGDQRKSWLSNRSGRVVGSASEQAATIRKPVHVNYCHAPTHYYWSRYDEYMASPGFGAFDFLARIGLKWLVGPLRKWDYKAAQRPNYIIANSTYIQDQIKLYYGRDSVVIHPPVDLDRFKAGIPSEQRRDFVISGRQTPYKRFDLAVAACSEINVPLKVIGNGPEHNKLVSMAGPTITFLTNVTDQELPNHFKSAKAFIFPGVDDFGISPVEAMAAGTPVIAYKAGGAMDYVIMGETGTFFDKQTSDSLARAIASFNSKSFHEENIVKLADNFSPQIFQHNIFEFINSIVL